MLEPADGGAQPELELDAAETSVAEETEESVVVVLELSVVVDEVVAVLDAVVEVLLSWRTRSFAAAAVVAPAAEVELEVEVEVVSLEAA